MRAIVTGIAGFIGSHVADLLIEQGYEVIGVDNLSTGFKRNINPKAKFRQMDIRSKEFLKLPKADYVFHLASLARIQPSIIDPVGHHDVNVNGTLNVLEYCRKHKAKIIFSGSSSVYHNAKLPTKEDSELRPISPYAVQKHICEQYIKLYRTLYRLEYAILRYFNVFGERQILTGSYAAVVGIFLAQRAKGEPLTIVGNGRQRRDFTYVKDVATANLMATKWQGTFNIGTGENYSVLEIANAVGGETKHLPFRAGEYQATQADITLAKAKGWQPTLTIKEWINANRT